MMFIPADHYTFTIVDVYDTKIWILSGIYLWCEHPSVSTVVSEPNNQTGLLRSLTKMIDHFAGPKCVGMSCSKARQADFYRGTMSHSCSGHKTGPSIQLLSLS